MAKPFAKGIIAAALALAVGMPAHAAGLGRLTVLSALGQPLNAEIEVVSLQPGEEEGLTARLASSEAFRQAGIDANPALSGVRFAIERRNGRPFIRLTSSQPVNEPFLDVLVELQWNTGRLVREYTFLLDPVEMKERQPQVAAAPAPAAPLQKPIAAPAPAPAARPEPKAAPAAPAASGKTHEVKRGETLAGIARQNLAPGVTLNQMLVAIFRANQDAFIQNNLNLVRSGRILNIPAAESAAGIDPAEAQRVLQAQSGEFNEYRRRLASAPAAAEGSAGRREVSGAIERPAAAKPPAGQADQLRLSKADPSKPAASGSRAAREDDKVAQERAKKEADSRVAELEKNVADLQKLLALRNQQLAQLEQKAGGKPAAEAPKPAAESPKPAAEAPKPAAESPKPAAEAPKPAAEAPKPAAEAPKPAAEAPKPAAEAPKPAPEAKKDAPKPAPKKAAPPPPEPSLVDEFLDNPVALGGLGGVIVLLGGYGAWAWRRKKAKQTRFQSLTGTEKPETGSLAAAAAAAAAAPAAAAAVTSAGEPSLAPAGQPATSTEAEEVDPIAEADVYMAYGRDSQAEEILKEALQKDASRVAVHSKLLEIYASRRDAKSFEQSALKVKSLTNGEGPDWDKAAALGRSIDPENGLYGSGEAAAVAAPVAAAPALDFDLGGGGTQSSAPDITLDEPEKTAPPSVDFDLGATTPPAAAEGEKSDFTPEGTLIMTADEAPKPGDGGLDFDLSADDKPAAPAAAPAAPAAAAPESTGGLDFDFNLDLGGGDKPAAPAAEAEKPAELPAMDLSSIDLDLGGGESAKGAGEGDPKWQEVATKLDLAKAYEEMGDKDGARELLNEVMRDGDIEQKGQAQQLLAKIG